MWCLFGKENKMIFYFTVLGVTELIKTKIRSLCTDIQYTHSVLTSVLSITCTKYDTAFPVQETARPLGLSSETLKIVPISTNQKQNK